MCREAVASQDPAAARAEFDSVLEQRSSGLEAGARFRPADGGWRHPAALANNCLADPAVAGIVLNLRDVTEPKRIEEALPRQADRDELTDLLLK